MTSVPSPVLIGVMGVVPTLVNCVKLMTCPPTVMLSKPAGAVTVKLPAVAPAVSGKLMSPASTPLVSGMLMVGVPTSTMLPMFSTTVTFDGVAAPNLIVSVNSISPSFNVATRTRMLVTFAGTLIVGVYATKVVPPSKETFTVPVSTPKVALPLLGVKFKFVAVVLGLLKVTTKSKLPPSLTLGLDTLTTLGESLSSGPGFPGGKLPVPSSRISVVTLPFAIVALIAPFKLTLNFSEPSKTVSLSILTVIVLVVSPGLNVNVPLLAVKSLPDTAVPSLTV